MLSTSHFMLKIALGFYGFGCIAAVGFPRRRWYVLLLLPALAANAAAVGLRYHLARPMLPMPQCSTTTPLGRPVEPEV